MKNLIIAILLEYIVAHADFWVLDNVSSAKWLLIWALATPIVWTAITMFELWIYEVFSVDDGEDEIL